MYQINSKKNDISPIQKATFSQLHYKERENLQERIDKNPNIFGEELLIIQKEFDWFSDTKERLDLLAIDKLWNLIIIENKLDDTWRDVIWQAMKYASYCSTLRKDQIISIYQDYLNKYNKWEDAKDMLNNFFEDTNFEEIEFNKIQSQRIIFVAANYRKEVTSTALWLMSYWLNIQCFKTTIFKQNEQHFLTFDQIIPVKEAEDYIISMANKQQEEIIQKKSQTKRQTVNKSFWNKLLPIINSKTDLFSNINATKDNRLSAGSGIARVAYTFVANSKYAKVELYAGGRNSLEENQKIFNAIYQYKDEIENSFWKKLVWEALVWKKGCRISYSLENVDITNIENWNTIIEFLSTNMTKLYKSINPVIKKVKKEIQ